MQPNVSTAAVKSPAMPGALAAIPKGSAMDLDLVKLGSYLYELGVLEQTRRSGRQIDSSDYHIYVTWRGCRAKHRKVLRWWPCALQTSAMGGRVAT